MHTKLNKKFKFKINRFRLLHSWKCNACCVMYSMKTYILYYLFSDASGICIPLFCLDNILLRCVSVWAIWRVIRTNKFYEFVIALFMLVVFFIVEIKIYFCNSTLPSNMSATEIFCILHKRFVSLLILFVSYFNGEPVM